MDAKTHKNAFDTLYKPMSMEADHITFPLAEIDRFKWNRGPWGDIYFSYFYKRFSVHVLDRLKIKKGHKILILGCGAGLDEKNLKVLFPDVKTFSIDISEEMILKAKANRSPSLFAVSLAEELPFKDNMFDRVLSREVIEHVISPDAMLREVSRVLKPGGVAVITTENEESLSPANFYMGRIRPCIARALGYALEEKDYVDEAPTLAEIKQMVAASGLELNEYFWDGALYKALLHLRPYIKFNLVAAAHWFSRIENRRSLAYRFCDQSKYILHKPQFESASDVNIEFAEQDIPANDKPTQPQNRDTRLTQTGMIPKLFKLLDGVLLRIYSVVYFMSALAVAFGTKKNSARFSQFCEDPALLKYVDRP